MLLGWGSRFNWFMPTDYDMDGMPIYSQRHFFLATRRVGPDLLWEETQELTLTLSLSGSRLDPETGETSEPARLRD